MNIFYISNSKIPSRTANSVHVMKMCQAYSRLGHQVTLIAPDWKKEIEVGVKDLHSFYGVDSAFRIKKIPFAEFYPFEFFHHAFLMPFQAFGKHANLIHSRALTAAWGASRFFHLPTLFETHSPPPVNPRLNSLFRQILTSRNLKAFTVITQALANKVKTSVPAGVRLTIAPDGVDQNWLAEPKSSIESIREKLGIKNGERRLAVYTGHLYSGRGIELILKVAEVASDHLFIIIGGNEEDLKRFQTTEHPSNVEFLGFKPPGEMISYLHAADVLLMPYSNKIAISGGGDTAAYASPMKMFEYMATGKPILSSNLEVFQEVLQNEKNALLLPPDDPQSWIQGLRIFQQNPGLAGNLGKQAKTDVVQYTWENRAQKLLSCCGF